MKAVFAAIAVALVLSVASAQLVGAPRAVDANDVDMNRRVHNVAQFAVSEIKKRCNCVSSFQLQEVISSRTQVVAGVNYLMDVVIVRDGRPEVHHVVVYDRFGDMSLTRDDVEQTA